MNHLLVFEAPMSAARAKRITKAISRLDAEAYVMPGWPASRTQSYQPAVLNTPENHIDSARRAIVEIAKATK